MLRKFAAPYDHVLIEDSHFGFGAQLLDVGPGNDEVAEDVAVKGDFAADFVHEGPGDLVSVSEDDEVYASRCGRFWRMGLAAGECCRVGVAEAGGGKDERQKNGEKNWALGVQFPTHKKSWLPEDLDFCGPVYMVFECRETSRSGSLPLYGNAIETHFESG
jgi:hypothetical protein